MSAQEVASTGSLRVVEQMPDKAILLGISFLVLVEEPMEQSRVVFIGPWTAHSEQPALKMMEVNEAFGAAASRPSPMLHPSLAK